MAEEKQQQNTDDVTGAVKDATETKNKSAANTVARAVFGNKGGDFKKGAKKGPRRPEVKDEFDQRILDIARVTRVMAGGKRMRFRTCVVIGDKKGKVGIGVAKGADVAIAVNKAVNKAKKEMIDVPLIKNTIPHEIVNKFGSATVLFKPAREGKGIIAGGVVRVILEIAGVKNITSKILGTNNKLSNAKCTIDALSKLRKIEIKKPVANTKSETASDKTADKDKSSSVEKKSKK